MNSLFKLLNKITQNYLGEAISYNYKSSTTVNVKGVFSNQWVEVNGVSAQALTCDIVAIDLSSPPGKGDTITRGSLTYKIEVTQNNEEIYTFILKE